MKDCASGLEGKFERLLETLTGKTADLLIAWYNRKNGARCETKEI